MGVAPPTPSQEAKRLSLGDRCSTTVVKKFSGIMARANVAERLTVTGRVSGNSRQVAVTSVDVDGVKYLLSTRGESQWVRNIRANPNVTLTVRGKSTVYVAAEVPTQERAPIIVAFSRPGVPTCRIPYSQLQISRFRLARARPPDPQRDQRSPAAQRLHDTI